MTIATPANATASPRIASRSDALEPEREREDHRHPGRERDDEGGDARRRVARADVEEHVVADDDQEPGGGDAQPRRRA